MSQKTSEGEKNRSRFKEWLDGVKDPYEGYMEVKPKSPVKESESQRAERLAAEAELDERIYDENRNTRVRSFHKAYVAFSIIFCIVLATLFVVTVSQLPPIGGTNNPTVNEVVQRYIESGLQETGAINIVAGMILDYRAFDTLGESHVLFTATVTVLILLRIDRKKKDGKEKTDRTEAFEPKNDAILQTVSRVLVPAIIVFGIYVILCGQLGPGGGFSGGAIIGAGLILYLNAYGFEKTRRFFNEKVYKITSVCALACYSCCKCYSFFCGANHLESGIPLGTPGAVVSGGLIFVLDICVGIVVAGTMYTFYVMFRKGGY